MPSRRTAWLMVFGCSALLGLSLQASLESALEGGRDASTSILTSRMLTGTVKSATGQALGGITVSARAVDKTLTTSVFTDERGNYIFPALEDGTYRMWAQAVGFDAARAEVKVDPRQERRQDFTLNPIEDFTLQLTGSQLMAALPEDTPEHRRMKQIFQSTCGGCPIPQVTLLNRFDQAGWRAIIEAMETAGWGGWGEKPNPIIQHYKQELAAYLAEMRGPGPSPMKFDLPAGPQGEAARVVITEYDVPPAEAPDQLVPHDGSIWSEGVPSAYWASGLHDVVPDLDGNVWITDSVANKNRSFAKVDTKTGKVTNFKVDQGDGYARGSHANAVGPDGIVWMNLFGTAGEGGEGEGSVGSLGRVDPKTGKLDIYTPEKGMSGVGSFVNVDGKNKVWTVTRTGALRFDPDTKQFTEFKSPTPGQVPYGSNYDVAGDLDGNGWWAILSHDRLGFADVKTGKTTEVQVPPRTEMKALATAADKEFYESLGGASVFGSNIAVPWAQGPRRLGSDPKRPLLWAGGFWGQNLVEVDTRTHKVTLHPVPLQNSGPYDSDVDKDGRVWVSLRNADTVGKFNPQTKQWVLYRMPTQGVEARQITVDRKRGEVWIPYWRTSKVARLQFRTEQQLGTSIAQAR